MNKTQIEMRAIIALEDVLTRSQYINPEVAKNDRTPSWDGNVFIYNQPGTMKKDLIGKIDIQVKGHYNKKTFKDKITYPVNVFDLRNYLNDSGVIYFVIYIKNFDDYKIYYNTLLPFDLTRLLKNAKDQKSKSIELIEFPKDELEIRDIFTNFIRNRDLQGAIDHRYLSLEDVENSDLPIMSYHFGFSGPGLKKSSPIDYTLNHTTYIYFKPSNYEAFFPIEKVTFDSAMETLIKDIKVNGEVIYTEYIVFHTKEGKTLKIGKGIEVDFKLKKINLKTCGSLSDSIRDIEFFSAIIKKKRITIGETWLQINEATIDDEVIKKLYSIQNSLLKIKELLELFEIKEELNFHFISKEGHENLKTLIKAFIDNEPVSLDSQEDLILGNMEVGNLRIYLLGQKDQNNKYRLSNYFSNNNPIRCFADNKGLHEPMSPFVMLKKNEILTCSNISFENIYRSIIGIPENENYFTALNYFVLELIEAYDDSGKMEIYELALKILDWIIEKQTNTSLVYLINKFQVVKRRRVLSIEELEMLLQLKNAEKDLMMLTGICILMDNFAEANLYYMKLDKNMQENFKEFPIYRLWERSRVVNY